MLCCLFSIISSSLFLYDKSCLTFIFAPHGYGSLKSFSELSAERGRSGHPAAGLPLSLSAEPCSDWVPLIMKRNKGAAASIEHAIDAKIKAEANKTELEREQFKESSRCFFFFPTLWCRCRMKPQVTDVNIQPDTSQDFTSSVLIPGLCQNSYIPHMFVWVFFFPSFHIIFTAKETLLFNIVPLGVSSFLVSWE